ncbi:MAG: DnaA regulatory inactivator Hda [Methylococcales bacterium]|jgi:DnaA family protein|nr:DnaA regulatory inactivator Hda [Methylococcales bacterium]MBT7410514.1 DnaA regulatory inactivator Hda [Methylococcales bacterium]
MTTQLILNFDSPDDINFNSFYPGANEEVIYHIKSLLNGKGEQFIYLWSPQGEGKSHLLQAACNHLWNKGQTASYIPLLQSMDMAPDILDGLENFKLICLDDIFSIAGKKDWEIALFNLFNRIKNSQAKLIISAKTPANQLPINLPDLRSRLSWGLTSQLHALDDAQKQAALKDHAYHHGFQLPDKTLGFLMNHCSRDNHTLFSLIDRLDKASMESHHKLTIPFIKKVLHL